MTEDEVRAHLGNLVEKAGGARSFAKKSGISQAHVYFVLAGQRGFGNKLLKVLGLEVASSHTTYRRIRK